MRKENKRLNIELVDEIRKMPNEIEDMNKITKKIIDDLESDEFPIPIVKIVRKLDFVVGKQRLEDNLSGYIAVSDMVTRKFGKNQMICINSNDNLGHQRFTLAHELAHYLFDYVPGKELYNTYRVDEIEDEKERRANQFAANLLMPEDAFRKQYRKYKKEDDLIERLMAFFAVSKRAVERRIIELNLI